MINVVLLSVSSSANLPASLQAGVWLSVTSLHSAQHWLSSSGWDRWTDIIIITTVIAMDIGQMDMLVCCLNFIMTLSIFNFCDKYLLYEIWYFILILIQIKYLYHHNIKTLNKAELIQLRRPVFPQVIGLNHLNKHKYHCRTTHYIMKSHS